MFRRSFNRIGQISAAVLAAAWLTTAAAPCRAQTGILAGQYMGAEEAEQAILATLDRRISVNFNERPLKLSGHVSIQSLRNHFSYSLAAIPSVFIFRYR